MRTEEILGVFNAQYIESKASLSKGMTFTGYVGPVGELSFTTERLVFKKNHDLRTGVRWNPFDKSAFENAKDKPIYLKALASKRDQLKIAEYVKQGVFDDILKDTQNNFEILNDDIAVIEPVVDLKTERNQYLRLFSASDLDIPAHIFLFSLDWQNRQSFSDYIYSFFPDKV